MDRYPVWVQDRNGKSYTVRNNLKIADVVLTMMLDSPQALWPLARTVEVNKVVNGDVISANIQVSDKSYVRPMLKMKLCPLELD